MSKQKINYPSTEKIPFTEKWHGVEIVDNFQWLEDKDNPKVKHWIKKQEELTYTYLNDLPQKDFLNKRLDALSRYDDETIPIKVIDGERIFFSAKGKDDEKWIYYYKENDDAEPIELINPNEWDDVETLHGTYPSRDGKYLAFGKAKGGDENPVIQIMNVDTGKMLPDTLKGWKQGSVSWLPDNQGFYYSAKPLKGDVPDGEEFYWSSAYYHELGTSSQDDKKVFYHDEVKEYWHYVLISEDGKYEIFVRTLFNKNQIYFRKANSDDDLIPITDQMDAEYLEYFIGDTILIKTDWNAPKGKVYITDVNQPQREHWREFIPETDDLLNMIHPINGKIYANYLHNAHTKIKIFELNGEYLRDIPLPDIGTAHVIGKWTQPEVWVDFSSFIYPNTIFRYDDEKDELNLYHKPSIDVDVSDFDIEQVWYTSRDGTKVSMFLIHRKDLEKDGENPVMLTGYGGFNAPMTPRFANLFVVWLEAGGMVAIPNLRGGGEYGTEWHEAGMRERKQNVFDDFLAAAEWLIDNDYTNPEKLSIRGGSNGGLLVGAAMIQEPKLFNAVLCSVPLLDMVRYHKFGIANIWAEEYGSAEDADEFKYLYAYSPYHNVETRDDYPAVLFIGSDNDARVDPLHARKMAALMQDVNPHGAPVLYIEQKASGHHGGTTISIRNEQLANIIAFLMEQLDMNPSME